MEEEHTIALLICRSAHESVSLLVSIWIDYLKAGQGNIVLAFVPDTAGGTTGTGFQCDRRSIRKHLQTPVGFVALIQRQPGCDTCSRPHAQKVIILMQRLSPRVRGLK